MPWRSRNVLDTPRPGDRLCCGTTAALVVASGKKVSGAADSLRLEARVTVIGMPDWRPYTSAMAPLSAMTTPDRVRAEALEDAALVARRELAALPPHVVTTHQAYASWGAAPFLSLIRAGAFHIVVFSVKPPWRHRRAITNAARISGTPLIVPNDRAVKRSCRKSPAVARKEQAMKIRVDYDLCEGHGQCVMAAPAVFNIPNGADEVTVLNDQPPEALREPVEEAASLCPVMAIHVED
jgi:ferredoxin